MRWKTTLFLAILFVTLEIFYYVYEIRLSPEREKSAQAKGRLWTVEQKDVEEVIVKRKADTVHVKREGADWVLLAPVKARADRSAVDDLISNLVTTRGDDARRRFQGQDASGLRQEGRHGPRDRARRRAHVGRARSGVEVEDHQAGVAPGRHA